MAALRFNRSSPAFCNIRSRKDNLEYSGRQLNLIMGHLLSKSADSATTDHDFGWKCAQQTAFIRQRPIGLVSFHLPLTPQLPVNPWSFVVR